MEGMLPCLYQEACHSAECSHPLPSLSARYPVGVGTPPAGEAPGNEKGGAATGIHTFWVF